MFLYGSFSKSVIVFISVVLLSARCAGQCESTEIIKLKNTNGSVYSGKKVTLTAKSDGKKYEGTSSMKGEVELAVPCDAMFDIAIADYTRQKEVQSAKGEGGLVMRTFTYEPDMAAKDKRFAMNTEEQSIVDDAIAELPDTIVVKGSVMTKPPAPALKNGPTLVRVDKMMAAPDLMDCYTQLTITIKDIDNGALADEAVSIIGEKRHKNIKAKTDKNGRLLVYLPKGDKYFLNFKYNKNFISTECQYTKGSAKAELSFSYLGTKEIERRKKIEAERIAEEAKRIKEEAEKFEKECKKLGITVEEGRRRETIAWISNAGKTADTVVSVVMNRNKNWSEKLIVCDLTGSMSPYAAQLAAWYQLSYLKEKNLQFVFFNDGDNKPDSQKKTGSTGGIYYAPSKGVDSLFVTIAKVAAAGWGGDCPENNMEALIKGVKMAKPYKELVMIADNNAPVKDIQLLGKFDAPVHIILCGVYDDNVLTDYMNIARKTKGSIHTMEQDLTTLASLSEGQEVRIGNTVYRIMGGEFVRTSKA